MLRAAPFTERTAAATSKAFRSGILFGSAEPFARLTARLISTGAGGVFVAVPSGGAGIIVTSTRSVSRPALHPRRQATSADRPRPRQTFHRFLGRDQQFANVEIGTLIDRDPAIRGGRPKIAGTGLTVRGIVGWYKRGMSPRKLPSSTRI